MTPCMLPETPDFASVKECLAELCTALRKLDHGAVESSAAWLEANASEVKRKLANGSDAADLLNGVRLARALVLNARRLYGGWAQAVAVQGVGYTPEGEAPSLSPPGRVAVNG